jgi:hypothetical protein
MSRREGPQVQPNSREGLLIREHSLRRLQCSLLPTPGQLILHSIVHQLSKRRHTHRSDGQRKAKKKHTEEIKRFDVSMDDFWAEVMKSCKAPRVSKEERVRKMKDRLGTAQGEEQAIHECQSKGEFFVCATEVTSEDIRERAEGTEL